MSTDFTETQPMPLDGVAERVNHPGIPEKLHELIDRHATAYSRYAAVCRNGALDQLRITQASEALTRARAALNAGILLFEIARKLNR